MLMPYSNKPDEIAPSTKYFNAASTATALWRAIAIRVYSDNDIISKPKYRVSKLYPDTITIMPNTDNITKTKNSPLKSECWTR